MSGFELLILYYKYSKTYKSPASKLYLNHSIQDFLAAEDFAPLKIILSVHELLAVDLVFKHDSLLQGGLLLQLVLLLAYLLVVLLGISKSQEHLQKLYPAHRTAKLALEFRHFVFFVLEIILESLDLVLLLGDYLLKVELLEVD